MNKTELVSVIAEKADLSKKDAEKALNAFVEAVEGALEKGDKIQLVGFGTFEVRERAARVCRNPHSNWPNRSNSSVGLRTDIPSE